MSGNLLTVVVILISAVAAVGALFVPIIVKRRELALMDSAPAPLATQTSGQKSGSAIFAIDIWLALRHIAILQFAVNFLGFLVGRAIIMTGASGEAMIVPILVSGFAIWCVGLTWSGMAVDKTVRQRFLMVVASSAGLITLLLNSLVLQIPLTADSLSQSFAPIFLSMIIANFIADRLKP